MESKFCRICNSSIPQHESAWIKPCLCPDLGAQVHRHCLLTKVQMKEERGAIDGGVMYCQLCGVHLNIVRDKGPLVRVLATTGRRWYHKFCEVAMKVCTVMFVDVTSTTLGLMVLYDDYGDPADRDMVLATDPLFGVHLCQAITYTCVVLNSLHWEEALLHTLRRLSNIPLVGRILPLEDNTVKVPAADRSSFFNYIVGSLLLPAFAGITGNLVFFMEPSWEKRLILGGVVFILVKGFLKAHFTQKTYARESRLSIADYFEHP